MQGYQRGEQVPWVLQRWLCHDRWRGSIRTSGHDERSSTRLEQFWYHRCWWNSTLWHVPCERDGARANRSSLLSSCIPCWMHSEAIDIEVELEQAYKLWVFKMSHLQSTDGLWLRSTRSERSATSLHRGDDSFEIVSWAHWPRWVDNNWSQLPSPATKRHLLQQTSWLHAGTDDHLRMLYVRRSLLWWSKRLRRRCKREQWAAEFSLLEMRLRLPWVWIRFLRTAWERVHWL